MRLGRVKGEPHAAGAKQQVGTQCAPSARSPHAPPGLQPASPRFPVTSIVQAIILIPLLTHQAP